MARVKRFCRYPNFTKEELLSMVEVGRLMKKTIKEGHALNILYHKSLGMIF